MSYSIAKYARQSCSNTFVFYKKLLPRKIHFGLSSLTLRASLFGSPHQSTSVVMKNPRIRVNASWLRHLQNNSPSKENWNTLYKYPGIKYIRVISRLKVYQILLMTGLFYPLYNWYAEGVISKITFMSAFSGCIGTSMIFVVFGYFSTKVIGELAVNDYQTLVRLSRLTFYGKRVEDYYNYDQIIPWLDESTDSSFRNYFQRMYVYDSVGKKLTYVYTLRHGNVSDKELFFHVVGIPYEDDGSK